MELRASDQALTQPLEEQYALIIDGELIAFSLVRYLHLLARARCAPFPTSTRPERGNLACDALGILRRYKVDVGARHPLSYIPNPRTPVALSQGEFVAK